MIVCGDLNGPCKLLSQPASSGRASASASSLSLQPPSYRPLPAVSPPPLVAPPPPPPPPPRSTPTSRPPSPPHPPKVYVLSGALHLLLHRVLPSTHPDLAATPSLHAFLASPAAGIEPVDLVTDMLDALTLASAPPSPPLSPHLPIAIDAASSQAETLASSVPIVQGTGAVAGTSASPDLASSNLSSLRTSPAPGSLAPASIAPMAPLGHDCLRDQRTMLTIGPVLTPTPPGVPLVAPQRPPSLLNASSQPIPVVVLRQPLSLVSALSAPTVIGLMLCGGISRSDPFQVLHHRHAGPTFQPHPNEVPRWQDFILHSSSMVSLATREWTSCMRPATADGLSWDQIPGLNFPSDHLPLMAWMLTTDGVNASAIRV